LIIEKMKGAGQEGSMERKNGREEETKVVAKGCR
jgi:hypothetical protein